MDGLKPIWILVAISFLMIIPISLASAQTCDSIGRFCVGDSVYECIAGEHSLLEHCPYSCSGGECMVVRMEPEDSFTFIEEEPEEAQSSDVIVYVSMAMVFSAMAILFLRIKRRK
jgi:hypothetical protein